MQIRTRILVVEDDEDLRSLVIDLLTTKGYEVFEANDGAAGLQAALRLVPDLVILDLNLPELRGTEVLRRLRLVELTRHIPVLVASAQLRDYAPELSGHQAELAKPYECEDLLSSVRSVLRGAAHRAPV